MNKMDRILANSAAFNEKMNQAEELARTFRSHIDTHKPEADQTRAG